MLTQTRAAPTITPTVHVTLTPTPTITPTAPVIGRVGEKIEAGALELTLISLERLPVIEKMKAATGETLLSLDVLLTNPSDQAWEYYPMFFRLRASGGGSSGVEYEPVNAAVWPALQGGTLQPGDFVRGHLAFRIPEEASGLRVRFADPNHPETAPLWVYLTQLPAVENPVVPSASALPQDLPGAGERIEAGGIAVTLEQVSSGLRLQNTRAAKGRIFVDLLATIENVSRPDTPYNPFYFKVKDAQGVEYPPVVIALDSLLHPGSLGPGQRITRHVVFEVPEATSWLIVSYLPQVIVEPYEEIRLGIAIPTPKKP
jgi:hypothetical protein